MKAQAGGDASRVLQSAAHTLFVEGKDNAQIDPRIIRELLVRNDLSMVTVQTMGACDNVRSAAAALHGQHPDYYFLIDRDDQKIDNVESSWHSFPDPLKHNLLIWRKRELENYFIGPVYLSKSRFLKPGVDIAEKVLTECNARLFLDCANLTLLWLERELRRSLAIPHFSNPAEFAVLEAAESALKQLPRLLSRKEEINSTLDLFKICTVFREFVDELSGGVFPLVYGTGTWLERMSGKEIFNSVANQWFEVRDNAGTIQTGKQKRIDIATDLVRLPLNSQPADFRTLLVLLRQRVQPAM